MSQMRIRWIKIKIISQMRIRWMRIKRIIMKKNKMDENKKNEKLIHTKK